MSIQFLGVIAGFHQDPMSFPGAPSGSHPFLATLPIFAKSGNIARGYGPPSLPPKHALKWQKLYIKLPE
jgi:hypothetical protein